jgi:YD repeat-containing protein
MIKILLTFCGICLCSILKVHSQTKISYEYDDAGNRIERVIVIDKLSILEPFPEDDQRDNERQKPFEEQFNQRKISIYPNPTKGNLAVNISGIDFNSTCKGLLYSMMGKKIIEFDIQSNTITPVKMDHLSPGMYILILIIDKEKLSYKIVKQ